MDTAKISEIFKSYQGEGLWQGKEQAFVRFFGCNLACQFCDTRPTSYKVMNLDQALNVLSGLGKFHSVAITGGEPLLQVDFLKSFCSKLKEKKKIIFLETNGVLYQNLKEIISWVDMISLDFKLPSSTGLRLYWSQHEKFIQIAQKTNLFVKIVIGRNLIFKDLDKAIELIKGVNFGLTLVLQPENPYEKEIEGKLLQARERCLRQSICATIIPQLHKKMGIK